MQIDILMNILYITFTSTYRATFGHSSDLVQILLNGVMPAFLVLAGFSCTEPTSDSVACPGSLLSSILRRYWTLLIFFSLLMCSGFSNFIYALNVVFPRYSQSMFWKLCAVCSVFTWVIGNSHKSFSCISLLPSLMTHTASLLSYSST